MLETLAIAAAGAAGGALIRLPTPALLGPLVVGSILHATGNVDITLPGRLAGLAHAIIGVTIGLRFTPDTLRGAVRVIPQLVLSTSGPIVLCARPLGCWWPRCASIR